jgi:quinol monooxygenase YgiN
MVIVSGVFEVEPQQRTEFLAGRHDAMRASRAEPGCLEYTFSADPLEPGRVLLFERWESQDSLDEHLSRPRPAGSPDASSAAPVSVSITVYDVVGERKLA